MNFPYRKILVVGCGGAGKSTFARAISAKTGINAVHLDKLWWLPNWVERNETDFDALLINELEKSEWIIEGNFKRTFELRLKYADFTVMLDISTDECIRSVLARTAEYKGRTRPDMTEGCIERLDDDFRKWIMNYNSEVRGKMLNLLENSEKPFIVFDTREKAYEWLNAFAT